MRRRMINKATIRMILVGVAVVLPSVGQAEKVDSTLLPGKWLEDKYVVFLEDGTWALQRHEQTPVDSAGRKWTLKGNVLWRSFPGGEVSDVVTRLDRKVMVLKDDHGNLHTYRRISFPVSYSWRRERQTISRPLGSQAGWQMPPSARQPPHHQ